MWTKNLPTSYAIDRITDELLKRKFEPVQGLERFRRTAKDERAIPPRPRYGAELGFTFQKDNLTVVVWTSWLLANGYARKRDCGWVLIEQDGRGMYYYPVRRGKNFVERILMEAKIERLRVRHRPECPKCNEPMRIVRGRGLGSRYWRCLKCRARESWDTPGFLAGLPLDAKRYLDCRRRARRIWQARMRREGKPIRQAMLRRKPWRKVKLPVQHISF